MMLAHAGVAVRAWGRRSAEAIERERTDKTVDSIRESGVA